MNRLEDLNEIAQRFCGAILFDGEGNACVVETNECFNFDNLVSTNEYDEVVTFEDCNNIYVENFELKDLPTNVKNIELIKARFIKELSDLPKSKRTELLDEIKRIN